MTFDLVRRIGLATSAALVTAAAAIISPASVGSLASAHADGCPDIEVVFARGTNEDPGLGRIGKTNTLPDRPEIRGMIRRVPHLVDVSEGTE